MLGVSTDFNVRGLFINAEMMDEVVNLVCIAIIEAIGLIGFTLASDEPSSSKLGDWYTPGKQIRAQHVTLTWPKFADAVDAVVDALLIVLDTLFVRPRIDVVAD